MVPVEYKVPIKSHPHFFTALFALWATGVLAIAVTIIFSMIDSSRYEVGLFLLVFTLLLVSFLAYNIVVWKYKGQEILRVLPDGLLLKRSGSFFKAEQFIAYHEFDSIEYDNDEQTSWWVKKYNLGGGKIKVNYLGTTKRFGQSLSLAEAEKLSSEMNKMITQIQASK